MSATAITPSRISEEISEMSVASFESSLVAHSP